MHSFSRYLALEVMLVAVVNKKKQSRHFKARWWYERVRVAGLLKGWWNIAYRLDILCRARKVKDYPGTR